MRSLLMETPNLLPVLRGQLKYALEASIRPPVVKNGRNLPRIEVMV
jgi:hypothetical protein